METLSQTPQDDLDAPGVGDDACTDAAHWRELLILLQRKAYKPTITPAEIAAQLPDLRELYRSFRSQSRSR